MCNALNHSPGCRCGFGGEGHLGRGPGGVDEGNGGFAAYANPIITAWPHRNEDFTAPTTCPRCKAEVFFVRHNGGSVYFDELGPPWPKHGCFDDDRYGHQLRQTLAAFTRCNSAPRFGVVVETVATRPGLGGRIIVHCSNGSVVDEEFDTPRNLAAIVGSLVLVIGDGLDVTLEFVQPPKDAAPPPRSILDYAVSPKFPWNALSRDVRLNNNLVGKVIEIIGNGHKFKLQVGITGEIKVFNTSFIVKQATQLAWERMRNLLDDE